MQYNHYATMDNFVFRLQKIAFALIQVFESWLYFIGMFFLQMAMFFLPVKFNLYFVGTLIIVDVVTALIALFMIAKKGSPTLRASFCVFYSQWTSKRAFDSIPKLMWYAMLVIVFYMLGYIIEEPKVAANFVTGCIAYVEIRSIIENGDKAFGTNIWELIIDSIKDFFTKPKI